MISFRLFTPPFLASGSCPRRCPITSDEVRYPFSANVWSSGGRGRHPDRSRSFGLFDLTRTPDCSEAPTQGNGFIVGVEITRKGRPDERRLSVLIIVPSGLGGKVISNVHSDVGHRLVIVIPERPQGLQDIELRGLPTDTGHAVSQLCSPLRDRLERNCGHAIVRVVVVPPIDQQWIIAVIETVGDAAAGDNPLLIDGRYNNNTHYGM